MIKIPNNPSKRIPIKGCLLWAIQPRRTAKTGVVQGDAARPKASPAAIGAKAGGTWFCQTCGSGPAGNGNFRKPKRFSPIAIAKSETNEGMIKGT